MRLLSYAVCLLFLLKAQNLLYWDIYLHNDPQRDSVHLWSFAHLTDVHIGEGEGDYGSSGYIDTLVGNEGGYAVERLRAALAYLKQNWTSHRLAFIAVTGDLTDSGERSEYLRFKALMDSSGLPYIAFIGNHDVWPYTSASNEAPWAYGDSLAVDWLNDMYPRFTSLIDTWHGSPSLFHSTWNPERNHPSRFHNFYFDYRGVRLVAVDGVSRKPAPFGQAGVGPDADLHDFPGGTIRFLDTLLSRPQPHPLIFLCHYPLIDNPASGVNSFSPQEYERIVNLLYPHRDMVRVWLAGHIHRTADYPLRHPATGTQFARCVETPANKDRDGGQFRIVRIWGEATGSTLPFPSFPQPSALTLSGSALQVRRPGLLWIYTPLGVEIVHRKVNEPCNIELKPGLYYVRFVEGNGHSWVRPIVVLAQE